MKYTLVAAILLGQASARLWSEVNCSECDQWPDYRDRYCLPQCIEDRPDKLKKKEDGEQKQEPAKEAKDVKESNEKAASSNESSGSSSTA